MQILLCSSLHKRLFRPRKPLRAQCLLRRLLCARLCLGMFLRMRPRLRTNTPLSGVVKHGESSSEDPEQQRDCCRKVCNFAARIWA